MSATDETLDTQDGLYLDQDREYTLRIYDEGNDTPFYYIEDQMNNEQTNGAVLAIFILYYHWENKIVEIQSDLYFTDDGFNDPNRDIWLIDAGYDNPFVTMEDTITMGLSSTDNIIVPTKYRRPNMSYFAVTFYNGDINLLIHTADPESFLQGFKTVFRDLDPAQKYTSFITSPIWYCDNNLELHERFIQ